MSDWLERELARELAAVEAPDTLGIRLGFAPAKPWKFPRLVLALAAVAVMIFAGGVAAGPATVRGLRQLATRESRGTVSVETAADLVAANWLRREAAGNVFRPAEGVSLTGARLMRCDGGAGIPFQANTGKATVFLAHSGLERPASVVAAPSEAGCRLCHSL